MTRALLAEKEAVIEEKEAEIEVLRKRLQDLEVCGKVMTYFSSLPLTD